VTPAISAASSETVKSSPVPIWFVLRPGLGQKYGGIDKIIDMQELAARFLGAPQFDRRTATTNHMMNIDDQSLKHVPYERIKIVARPLGSSADLCNHKRKIIVIPFKTAYK